MKFIVTGGAGFIGCHLINLLLENIDNTVVNIDKLTYASNERSLNDFEKNSNYSLHKVDIVDYQCVKKIINNFKPDAIFHLAALARIQPSFDNPLETISVNAQGTANICELARRIDSKVVYAGSSSFYGGAYLNPYAFTKWQGEEVCKLFSKIYNLSVSIARFFNVYGDRHVSTGAYATVIGIFENQYKNQEVLTITGDGEQRRDFTHVFDIANANYLAMNSNKVGKGEVINIGNSDNRSVNDIANMIGGPKVFVDPVIEPRETLADNTKAKELLGWEPTIEIEDWVPKYKKQLKIKDE